MMRPVPLLRQHRRATRLYAAVTNQLRKSSLTASQVMFGPGYRIYFAKDGLQLVLLLLGGDQSTQSADVARAQKSWQAYQEGKRRGKTK